MTLRYGILGTAGIVPRFLAGLKASGAGEAVAVASRDVKRAEGFALSFGIPHAMGYDELIASDQVDVVYVALPNGLHYEYAKAALMADKHVLCEKPITLRVEQAAELFALAKARGRFLMEGQKGVFLPLIQAVKALLDSGVLGRVWMVEAAGSYDVTNYAWYDNAELGGGILFGHAIYAVEMLPYLLGEEIVSAQALFTQEHREVESQVALTAQFESGALLNYRGSVLAQLQNGAILYAEKGRVEIPDFWKAGKAKVVYTEEPEEERDEYKLSLVYHKEEQWSYPAEHEMQYELVHVAECIEKGLTASPVMTAERSMGSIQLLEGLLRDWRETR